jgi:SAM-dependent methyltransferase
MHIEDTKAREYTEALIRLQTARWKVVLDVQAPYRWNLRRLKPGFTLEIGCGIGRNLAHLSSNGVGLDHNPYSVEYARSQGLDAFTPEAFRESRFNAPGTFDSLLLSHVAEHMDEEQLVSVLREYVDLLKPEGRIIMITPQEVGYRSDRSHVTFMDFERIRAAVGSVGFTTFMEFSFPFPRPFGRIFIYNEFVSVSRRS